MVAKWTDFPCSIFEKLSKFFHGFLLVFSRKFDAISSLTPNTLKSIDNESEQEVLTDNGQ